ncbi:MAG: PIN domain-containing protein [Ignavibacteriae bacterium]|nr:PIN domain-containing protein [Ignavibacteriota bacterium]
MDVIAVDTGILVHAAIDTLPHHKFAVRLVERAINLEFIGCITGQVLLESYAVLTKFGANPKRAVALVQKYRKIFAVIHPTSRTTDLCLARAERLHNVTRSQIYDLFLASTILDNNIDVLLTFNVRHFKRFKFPITILDAKKF